VRDIIASKDISFTTTSNTTINRYLHKYNFLSNINDHRLIAEAAHLAKGKSVFFITADGA